jgi:hypothetical protein
VRLDAYLPLVIAGKGIKDRKDFVAGHACPHSCHSFKGPLISAPTAAKIFQRLQEFRSRHPHPLSYHQTVGWMACGCGLLLGTCLLRVAKSSLKAFTKNVQGRSICRLQENFDKRGNLQQGKVSKRDNFPCYLT